MRFLLFILLFVLGACEQEVDLNIDFGKNKTVLNCILVPDSNIVLSLTKTAPVNDTGSFSTVDDACVMLYENNILLDTLKFMSPGFYSSKYISKTNTLYTIKVHLSDSTKIEASDSVPLHPEVDSFLFLNNNKGRIQLKLVLNDQQASESFYKIELFEKRENTKEYKTGFRTVETYRYMNLLDTSMLFRDYEFINKKAVLTLVCDAPKAKSLHLRISQLSKSYFSYSVFATQNYVANYGADYSRVPNFSNVSNKVGILGAQSSLDFYIEVGDE